MLAITCAVLRLVASELVYAKARNGIELTRLAWTLMVARRVKTMCTTIFKF